MLTASTFYVHIRLTIQHSFPLSYLNFNMAERVKLLVQKRTSLKAQITGLTNLVERDRYDKTALKLRMARVTDLYHTYEEYNDELIILDPSDSHKDQFTNVQDRFYSLAGKIEEIINPNTSTANTDTSTNASQSNNSESTTVAITTIAKRRIKLPEASLPQFDGHYENWLSFKNAFRAMIDSQADLADTEKLQYLKSALRGKAANKIKILSIDGSNYHKAWELLTRSYEVKRILISRHLSLLLNMPVLDKESTESLSKLADDA